MKSLIENLYNNNVLFTYYGFIDESVLKQVVQITKTKLQGFGESETVISKVYNAINECVENIIKHNFYPDDERVHYKSLLVISKQEDHYLVGTINVINSSQQEIINHQLEYLRNCSEDELLNLKSETSTTTTSLLVNRGLIDLVLKADRWECSFKQEGENTLLNINYKVNILT
jgi:hypothetical protein